MGNKTFTTISDNGAIPNANRKGFPKTIFRVAGVMAGKSGRGWLGSGAGGRAKKNTKQKNLEKSTIVAPFCMPPEGCPKNVFAAV